MKIKHLEMQLINPNRWEIFYEQMPQECKNVVDNPSKQGGPTGIGLSHSIGWFILGAGQGPQLLWSETSVEIEENYEA